MLEFGLMEVEGFGSILEAKFNWNKKGLNIIQAPNGTGKSKFVNALVWCLYGKTLSGSVEMWDHLRPGNYMGVKVTLYFTVKGLEFKVIRCKDYKGIIEGIKGKNRLVIYEDGEEVELDDKGEANNFLQGLIGYSFDLFKNSIIFGQKLKRLVSESGPNKKKLLDEAFEVMYIAQANKNASSKLQGKKTELSTKEILFNNISQTVENDKQNLEDEKERVNNFESDKANEIGKLKGERKIARTKLRELKVKLKGMGLQPSVLEYTTLVEEKKKELEKYKGVDIKLAREEQNLIHLQSESERIIKYQNKVKEKLNHIPDNCSNCKKPFTKLEKKEELERINFELKGLDNSYQLKIGSISKLKSVISELKLASSSEKEITLSIDTYKKKIKELEDFYRDKAELEKQVENKSTEIKNLTSRISEISEKSLKNYIEKFTRTLREHEEELAKIIQERDTLKTEVEDLQWIISDPLSNSGIKSYIFNQMVGSINKRLEYYSKFSGLSIQFIIDMESALKNLETIIFQGVNPVNYDELSGGQQQKVDIVLIFAIHDVVSNNKDCSLMVMDELFEGLDADNIEILTELIVLKSKTKCLYLITHRTEFNPTNSNIIQLENINGFTLVSK